MLPTASQIRAARALLGITQEEAAALVGVSGRTWTDVEKGIASEAVIERVMGVMLGQGVEFTVSRGGKRRGVSLGR